MHASTRLLEVPLVKLLSKESRCHVAAPEGPGGFLQELGWETGRVTLEHDTNSALLAEARSAEGEETTRGVEEFLSSPPRPGLGQPLAWKTLGAQAQAHTMRREANSSGTESSPLRLSCSLWAPASVPRSCMPTAASGSWRGV